jgi:hypothetical protein
VEIDADAMMHETLQRVDLQMAVHVRKLFRQVLVIVRQAENMDQW